MGFMLKPSPGNELSIFKNKIKFGDYCSFNCFTLWENQNKQGLYKEIFLIFGIRRSNVWQLFPIWIINNVSQKSVLLGFWKVYIEVGYKI